MYLATWRGRFGLTPELFHENLADRAAEINAAAQRVRDLINGS